MRSFLELLAAGVILVVGMVCLVAGVVWSILKDLWTHILQEDERESHDD